VVRARGDQETYFLDQTKGLDHRAFPEPGSALSVEDMVISPLGYVQRARGIASLVPWSSPSSDPFGATKPIVSMGTYFRGGSTDLIVAYGDASTITIAIVEANILTDLLALEGSDHAEDYPRFAQIGNLLWIYRRGSVPYKYDGQHIVPAGVRETPPPPEAKVLGTNSLQLWDSYSLHEEDAIGGRVLYYSSYVNIHGQEGRLSAPSNPVLLASALGAQYTVDRTSTEQTSATPARRIGAPNNPESGSATTIERNITGFSGGSDRVAVLLDLGDPPSDPTISHRALYRSINSAPPTALPRRLGAGARTHWDVRRMTESSTDPAPSAGDMLPPPACAWGFNFRGRHYVLPDDNPSSLRYSALNAPEAFPAVNILPVGTPDTSGGGNELTGFAAAQDFVLVFKRASAFMLTHNREETPTLLPLEASFGAVSDRAVTSLDGRIYFLAETGLYEFDGSRFRRLSQAFDTEIRRLPEVYLEAAVAWPDRIGRRVLIAANRTPGADNNIVYAIHLDHGGAVTTLVSRSVTSAIVYKGRMLVGYNRVSGSWDLGQFGVTHRIDGASVEATYETAWLSLSDPDSDKRFNRMRVFFLQSRSDPMTVEWRVDWDDRTTKGSDTFTLAATDAELWNSGNWDSSTRLWDVARMVTKTVNIAGCRGKVVRFRFRLRADDWNFVGFKLFHEDHGSRAKGTDDA